MMKNSQAAGVRPLAANRGQRVMVAMSGGVDSAVAALLLQGDGYEVIGATMQVWPRQQGERGCCGLPAIEDARRIAWQLGIPHYVLDLREEFEDRVIDYFCREYHAGRTPNPCIACNRYLKFGSMLQKARDLGASYLSTGHYARIRRNEDDSYMLCTAIDTSKDQTYALYQMTQSQLEHVLFPLGDYRKQDVRQIARQAGLPVAEKAESQEICFVSGQNYAGFVAERTGYTGSEGLLRHVSGDILGRHRGICCYTVGQRKGLGISSDHPLYVTRIDPETNTIWVGAERDLYQGSLVACDVNYISGAPFVQRRPVTAKIRYKAPHVEAIAATAGEDRLRVDFRVPQKAITPGQAVVLYDGDMVLGGGTIIEVGAQPELMTGGSG
jgi:tRNA-specific 2-thiouridylase